MQISSKVSDVLQCGRGFFSMSFSWRILVLSVVAPLLYNSILLFLALSASQDLSFQEILYIITLSSFRLFFFPSLLLLLGRCFRAELIYSYLLFGLYSILFIIEFILIRQQGAVYSQSIASIFLSSNLAETGEFMGATISWMDIFTPSFVVFVFGIGSRYVSNAYIPLRYAQTLVAFLLSLVCSNAVISQYRFYTKLKRVDFAGNISASYIDRFVWGTATSLYEGGLVETRLEKLYSEVKGKVFIKHRYENLNVVVVIGESLRRDYMHCYGYRLNNTPHLDSLISQGSIIPYTDVQSPASSTVLSLLHVLTTKTVTDSGKWFDYPSLNLLFREAGFSTRWYSNQESSGFTVQPITSIAKFSDEVHFVSQNSEEENYRKEYERYDGEVLSLLGDRAEVVGNRLHFFHLMGSHYTYAKRFPKSYARFKASDLVEVQGEKAEVVANYVNSILYNDHVLSLLIKEYQDDDTILIYFSDHGEVLYDDPKRPDYLGHGGEVVVQGLTIPFLVYMSPSFRTKYPSIVTQVSAARNKPIMTDILTNSLCGLFGISYEEEDERLNFFSDKYDTSRPRKPVGNDLLDENL